MGPSVVSLVCSLVSECPAAVPDGSERTVFRVGRSLSGMAAPIEERLSGDWARIWYIMSVCRPGGGRGMVGGVAVVFSGPGAAGDGAELDGT